jgi:LysR family hydrogen peroxide-inducible transcriptional activator
VLNVNLRHLHYLVTLADVGSYARAAAKVGVTQSTLSAAIQGLEAELGGALVDRSARRIQILPFGEAIVRRAREILLQVQELPEYAADRSQPLTTRLRLGVIPSIAPFILPKLLRSLRASYPSLSFNVREGLTQALLADVRSGRLDCAFIARVAALEEFDHAEVGKDPFLLAVPEHHRLAARHKTALADLVGEKVVLLDHGHCLRDQVLSAIGGDAPAEESDVRAASIMTLVQLVEFGMGVTLLPRLAVDAGATAGTSLRLVPYSGPGSERTLVLAWRAGALRRPDYEALAAHLRGHCLRTEAA